MVSQVAARERQGSVSNQWYAQAPATGMQAGDYMFMHVSVDTTSGQPAEYPAGWDQFHKGGAQGIGFMVCGKPYEAGDDDKEWSGSHSGGTEGYSGVIEVFRGLEPVSIISNQTDEGAAVSIPIPPLTLTTTLDDDNFYVINMGDSANADIGFPGNYPSNQNEYAGTGVVNGTGSSVTCCVFDHPNKSRPVGNFDHSEDTDGRVLVILGFNGGTLPLPATPTGLAAVATGLSADITWNDAADAESWTLEKSLTGGAPWTVLADQTTVRAYQDLLLTSGETYWYRVKAINAKGEGSYATTSVTITYVPAGGGADTVFFGSTAIGAGKLKLGSADIGAVHLGSTKIWPGEGGDPNAPTPVTLTISDPNVASLQWTASTNSLYYRVYRSTTQGGVYTEIASNITGLTYSDTPGIGTWWYKVDAVGVYGASAQSNSESTTVLQTTGFTVVVSEVVKRLWYWTIPPECQAGDILMACSTAGSNPASWTEGNVFLLTSTALNARQNWVPGYKILEAGDIGGVIATGSTSSNGASGFAVQVVRPNGSISGILTAEDIGAQFNGQGAVSQDYTPPNNKLGIGLWVGHCQGTNDYSVAPDATLIEEQTEPADYFWSGQTIQPPLGSQTTKTGAFTNPLAIWPRSVFLYLTVE